MLDRRARATIAARVSSSAPAFRPALVDRKSGAERAPGNFLVGPHRKTRARLKVRPRQSYPLFLIAQLKTRPPPPATSKDLPAISRALPHFSLMSCIDAQRAAGEATRLALDVLSSEVVSPAIWSRQTSRRDS
jgi:hypothetical protein